MTTPLATTSEALPSTVGLVNMPSGRLVVLAVNGQDDGIIARWSSQWLASSDRVHVVNVYEPMPRTQWEPVVLADRARSLEAERTVARAEAPIKVAGTAAEVDGEVIPGDAVKVLRQLSALADVLVVGADVGGGEVTARLVRSARSVVIVVPTGSQRDLTAGRPVTALLPTPVLPETQLNFAAREAARLGAALRVVRLASALRHPEVSPPEVVAEDQIELAEQLLPLREAVPDAAIVAETDFRDASEVIMRVAQSSSLLVVAHDAVALVTRCAGFAFCPVAVVPSGSAAIVPELVDDARK